MANEIKILSQTETTKPNDAGQFRAVIITRFMVGTDGPFRVEQDEATFSPETQIALVNAKASLLAQSRGAFGG